VLGSKQVKALVVRGGQKAEFADAGALKALVNETRAGPQEGHLTICTPTGPPAW